MRERRYSVARPVTETSETREAVLRVAPCGETRNAPDTSYDTVRSVAETSERKERYTVARPVVETQEREERQVVRRQVVETAERDEAYYRGRTGHDLSDQLCGSRPVRRTTDRHSGQGHDELVGTRRLRGRSGDRRSAYQRAGLAWIRNRVQRGGSARAWQPNVVAQQIPQTTMVQRVVSARCRCRSAGWSTKRSSQGAGAGLPDGAGRTSPPRAGDDVPTGRRARATTNSVQVWEMVEEEVVRRIPVTTMRMVTEERVEQIPVQVCKIVAVQKTVRVPRVRRKAHAGGLHAAGAADRRHAGAAGTVLCPGGACCGSTTTAEIAPVVPAPALAPAPAPTYRVEPTPATPNRGRTSKPGPTSARSSELVARRPDRTG